MNIPIRMLSIVGLIAGLAAPAQAATLITPTDARASKATALHDALNTIDGAGMTVTGDQNVYTHWTNASSSHVTAKNDGWTAQASTNTYAPWLIVDLGAIYDLETISIWNMNPADGTWVKRAAQTVNIYTSTTGFGANNGNNDDDAFDTTGWTGLTSGLTVTQNPGGTTNAAPNGLVTGLGGVKARWVAFEVTSVHGYLNDRKRASIGEVQFFATPGSSTVVDNSESSTVVDNSESSTVVDIPEPSMLGLVVVSGMVALLRRPRANRSILT